MKQYKLLKLERKNCELWNLYASNVLTSPFAHTFVRGIIVCNYYFIVISYYVSTKFLYKAEKMIIHRTDLEIEKKKTHMLPAHNVSEYIIHFLLIS